MFSLTDTVANIKNQIAGDLDLAPQHFDLFLNNEPLKEHLILGNYAINVQGETLIELKIEFLREDKARVREKMPQMLYISK